MRFVPRTALCLLVGGAFLFSGVDAACAEEPAPGGGPPAAQGESASPKAKKAPKKSARKKGSRKRAGRKKAGKRVAKKGGKRAAGKRPDGAKRRGTRPLVEERAAPGVEAKGGTVPGGEDLRAIAMETGADPAPPRLQPQTLLPAGADGPRAAPAEPPVTAQGVGESGETAPTVGERIVAAARRLLDIPYRFGGSTLLGIDCSGYVRKVFGFFGHSLPRTAREMFGLGTEVGRDDLSLGDLVFFRTYASFPSHVGIYIGNNMFIHASARDRKVKVDSLDAPYYLRNFIGGKRLPLEPGKTGD